MKKQRLAGNKNNKLGFSLMELSIVILVIGILVLGVTKGSTIIYKARIGSAQSLTKSSPASSIPDMVAWYETSLNTSFVNGSAYSGTSISTWIDNSPRGGNNATQTPNNTKDPYYVDSVLNSLPVVRFNGTGNASNITPSANTIEYMTFDASGLNSSDYTIFVVQQRNGAATGTFLAMGAVTTNTYGYSATGTVKASNSGAPTATVANYSSTSLAPSILTFYSNGSSPTTVSFIAVNGVVSASTGTGAKSTFSANTGTIGTDVNGTTTPYSGDIAEIIIYGRALTINERNDVQYYLAKKYSLISQLKTSAQ